MVQKTIDSMLKKGGKGKRSQRAGVSQAQFHLSVGQRKVITEIEKDAQVVPEWKLKALITAYCPCGDLAIRVERTGRSPRQQPRAVRSSSCTTAGCGRSDRAPSASVSSTQSATTRGCGRSRMTKPPPPPPPRLASSTRTSAKRGSGLKKTIRKPGNGEGAVGKTGTVISAEELVVFVESVNRGLCSVGTNQLVRVYSRWEQSFYIVMGTPGLFRDYWQFATGPANAHTWAERVVGAAKSFLFSFDGCASTRDFRHEALRQCNGLDADTFLEVFNFLFTNKWFNVRRIVAELPATELYFGPVLLALDTDVLAWSADKRFDTPRKSAREYAFSVGSDDDSFM